MIYSSLNAKDVQCTWPEVFQKAFAFLKKSDLEHMEPGRYEIDGDDVYATIQKQTTAAPEEKKAESHYKYIDIQYLIRGKELQGYAPLPEGAVREEHPERDVIYYPEVEAEHFIELKPGDFTVYFTNDIHRPNCAAGESMDIKKVVLKIREAIL